VDLAPEHVERVREIVFDGLDDNDARHLADIAEKIVAQLDDASWIFRDTARDPELPCPKHRDAPLDQQADDGGSAA
jgi:hypothetical protein